MEMRIPNMGCLSPTNELSGDPYMIMFNFCPSIETPETLSVRPRGYLQVPARESYVCYELPNCKSSNCRKYVRITHAHLIQVSVSLEGILK